MRLLLIEDNTRLAQFISDGLSNESLPADCVNTAEDALAALAAQKFDLLLLDLGLPDIDGLVLLEKIRAKDKHTPILILTAREALEDRLKGLNNGADDYLLKPFAIEELVARIRALLRRPGQSLGSVLEAGNITLDTNSRTAAVGGAPLHLTRREGDLLEQLMRGQGNVVTKDAIESRLYSYGDAGSANAIEALVHRLRDKLKEAGAVAEIHTLRGIGYMLAGSRKKS